MKSNLSNNFSELNKTVQEYLKVHIDLAKLTALEKMTKISVFMISFLVGILLASLFFIFFASAFVFWYGNQFQNYLTGLFIVIGFIILLALFYYFFGKSSITTSIIKNLSAILFEDEDTE